MMDKIELILGSIAIFIGAFLVWFGAVVLQSNSAAGIRFILGLAAVGSGIVFVVVVMATIWGDRIKYHIHERRIRQQRDMTRSESWMTARKVDIPE